RYESEDVRDCEESRSEQLISFVTPSGPGTAELSGLVDGSATSGGHSIQAQALPAEILKSDGGLRLSRTPDGAWHLASGSALLRVTGTLRLRASGGHVTLKKGALVSLDGDNGTLRVRVLSGPGHVAVVAAGKTIPLGPGREAYLSDHILADDEAHCRD